MSTLYLTEDRALVRRDSEDCLLVQIPERRATGGVVLAPARQERVPLVKIDDVAVTGEVTLTASDPKRSVSAFAAFVIPPESVVAA